MTKTKLNPIYCAIMRNIALEAKEPLNPIKVERAEIIRNAQKFIRTLARVSKLHGIMERDAWTPSMRERQMEAEEELPRREKQLNMAAFFYGLPENWAELEDTFLATVGCSASSYARDFH